MGFQLEDGMGSGRSVHINDENRIETESAILTQFSKSSIVHGESFSWTAVSTDLAATLNLMYLANNSTAKHLRIHKIYVWSDVSTQFKIWLPSVYTAPNGTSVTGVNFNRTSGAVANATCTSGESTNTLVANRVITTVRNNEVGTDQFGQWIDYGGSVVLGYHDSICVYGVADSAAFEVTILGYFHVNND